MARDRDRRHAARLSHDRHVVAEVGRLTADSGPRDDPDREDPARHDPARLGEPPRAVDDDDLTIDVREGPIVTVHLTGDLDLRTSAALGDRLRAITAAEVVIECEDLRFVDSIGVTTLVRMHHDFRERGGTLALRGITGVPRRTLEILGLTETLDIDLREPDP